MAMTTNGQANGSGASLHLMRSTTDELLAEAVSLSTALRDLLLAAGAPGHASAVPPLSRLERMVVTGELTALLGYAVAWLLTRKAVEAGELSAAAARSADRRLATPERVAATPPDACDPYGRRLTQLDGQVRALHARLARLDQLLDRPH